MNVDSPKIQAVGAWNPVIKTCNPMLIVESLTGTCVLFPTRHIKFALKDESGDILYFSFSQQMAWKQRNYKYDQLIVCEAIRLSVPQTGLNGAFLGANFQLQINTYLLLGCVFKAAGEWGRVPMFNQIKAKCRQSGWNSTVFGKWWITPTYS